MLHSITFWLKLNWEKRFTLLVTYPCKKSHKHGVFYFNIKIFVVFQTLMIFADRAEKCFMTNYEYLIKMLTLQHSVKVVAWIGARE